MKTNEIITPGSFNALASVDGITPAVISAGSFWTDVGIDVYTRYGNLDAGAVLEYFAQIPETVNENIVSYLLSKYKSKWAHIVDALELEYNPIWNVDGTETITNSGTDTHTAGTTDTRTDNLTDETTHGHTLTRTHADTDTRTDNLTDEMTHGHTLTRTHADTDTETLNNSDTLTHGLTSTATHEISGDNGGLVISGKDTTNNTGNDVTAHSGTVTDAHTGTITDANSGKDTRTNTGTQATAHTGTITDANTGKDTHTNTGTQTTAHTGENTDEFGHIIETVRQGNIGLTSTQNLITQEIELRAKHVYFDIVVNDIKNALCGCVWRCEE